MAALPRGKIIYGDASGAPAALALGTNGQTLKSDGTDIAWADNSVDGAVVFNESGADVDFRVESDDNANMLFVDGGNDRVGIGTASPDLKLDVTHATAAQYIATFQNTANNNQIKIGNQAQGYLNIQGARIDNGNSYNLSLQADGSNVGIGTTTPGVTLEVKGSSAGVGTDSEIVSIQTATADHRLSLGVDSSNEFAWIRSVKNGAELPLILQNGGKVGIGVTNPTDELELKGDTYRFSVRSADHLLATLGNWGNSGADIDEGHLAMYSSGTETIRIATNASSFFNGGNIGIGTASPGITLDIKKDGSNGNIGARIWNTGTATNDDAVLNFTTQASRNYSIGIHRDSGNFIIGNADTSVASGELLSITLAGNVGIGDTSPARALSTKSSSVTVGSFESTSASGGMIGFVDSNTTNDVTVRAGALGNDLVLQAGGSTRATIFSTGLSTFTGPASQVNLGGGSTGSAALYVNSTSGHTGEMLQILKNGSTRMHMANDGKLGIGTASIDNNAKLHIEDSAYPIINLDRSSISSDGNHIGYINFQNNGDVYGYIGVWVEDISETDGELRFATQKGTSLTDKMVITSDGEVGIGTTGPTAKLEIHGNSDTSDEDVQLRIVDNDTSAGSKIPSLAFFGGGTQQVRMRGSDSGLFISASASNNDDLVVLSGGNVGIGAIPKATETGWTNVSIGGLGTIINSTSANAGGRTQLANNVYTDTDGNYSYISTDEASLYKQIDGIHSWHNAASGSADAHISMSERMRIDASGNTMVGKTASSGLNKGVEFRQTGLGLFTADGTNPLQARRLSSDGNLVAIYKDSALVGNIGTYGGATYFAGNTHGILMNGSDMEPSNIAGGRLDNTVNLGSDTYRFKDGHFVGELRSWGSIAAADYSWGSSNATFGQDRYRLREMNNLFYAADKRFGGYGSSGNLYAAMFDGNLDAGHTIATSTTLVVTIDTSALYQSTYPAGSAYISFYHIYNQYQSCTMRQYHGAGTYSGQWRNCGAATDYRGSAGSGSRVVKIDGAGNNYVSKWEITFVTSASQSVIVTDIAYYMTRPAGAPSVPFLAKDRTEYLTEDIYFKNNAGSTVGSIVVTSSTAYNTSSDYRLKENIIDITSASEKVKQLKPKKFNWISDDTNTLRDGFLAHEVATVVPEAVTGEKDAVVAPDLYEEHDPLPDGVSIGDVKTTNGQIEPQQVDQSKLVPVLTAALKEAITKIETLETKVAALEG
jgi:hypothetical protein